MKNIKDIRDMIETKETKEAQPQKTKRRSKKQKKIKARESIIDTKDSKLAQNKTQESKEIKEVYKVQAAQVVTQVLPRHKEHIEKSQELEMSYMSYDDEEMAIEDFAPKIENISAKPQAKGSLPQAQNTQNKGNVLTESLAILESKDKNHKDSRKDERRQGKGSKSEEIQASQPKAAQIQEERISFEDMLAQQYIEEEEPKGTDLLHNSEKKQKEKAKEVEEQKESKTQKSVAQKQSAELSQTKESTRSQILYRSALARENMRNFAQTLREEILNYKPPLTKLSMELNPRNLGTLELTITKKGKDLHVQVVSNATAVGLFLQNQVDFKNNLAQVGFDNVDLSFSTSDKGSGGNQREQNASQNGHYEKGNKNSLEDSQESEINVMNITLPKYA
ncbi:MAG: flagellar hook-length control protein FliK [Helicobacter sp.]|uniref:flagellar hook-length control protein FliK n=1 Tax=Helicobacter sp. TaxID=218 RepID=UPI0025C402FD|nr:flagellar hook-length control protein FliK [Helicobacter sp.]MCH5313666.1 flagellar hook-length control protein FliK [Helicobacter sp.]